MRLIKSIHHLTFITADMDRLISFYQRVFDARVIIDLEEDGLRHTFIEVGEDTYLHPVHSRCSSAGGWIISRSTLPARKRFVIFIAALWRRGVTMAS
jgi:catechol 2,3-dioxygenase-like lactoylglutathione lyase family enzyme